MELQNQIYLLVAVFGGVSALLLVLIVILAVFIINIRKTIAVKDSDETRYQNYGFEHETKTPNITDDLRSMKSEVHHRQPAKSNLSKPRNDDRNHQQNDRLKEKHPQNGTRDGRKRQYSESGDTSGRDFDSAFDNEINNMFDIDDDDDSMVSERNTHYNHQNQRQGNRQPHAPPPAPSTGQNRNRNMNGGNRYGGDGGHQQQNIRGMNRLAAGGDAYPQGAMYHSGNSHEAKTYFNDRGINY